MITTLIALFVGLGGGGGIATLVNTFLNRNNERTKIDIEEDRFERETFQQLVENLWKDNDILREEIRGHKEEITQLKQVIKTLESRLVCLENGV